MANYTREPGVASREQVVGYSGSSVSNEQLQTLTYVQIVAETGTTDPVVVDSLYSLLNNFTYDKAVTAAMPRCFLEAAFMAQYCPLLVQRIAPAITSNTVSKVVLKNASNEELVTITHKYPNNRDIINISVTPVGEDGDFTLVVDSINSKGESLYSETYKLSTDANSVNTTGVSNSADIVNDYRDDITVVLHKKGVPSKLSSTSASADVDLFDDSTPKTGTVPFGKYVASDGENPVTSWYNGNGGDSLVTAWKAAISEVSELEVPTPYLMFSTTIPVNPTTNQLACDKLMMEEAAAVKSWPIMNPYCPTAESYEYNNIRSIGAAYAGTSSLGNLTLPGFYDSTLLGRKLLLGGGLDYHRTICNNYATSKPFAPIMGTSGNGTSSAKSNLAAVYKKSERLELLNSGVTVIRYNKVKDLAYYLMNNSLNTTDDSISEEQNRRLMNKVSHDIDELLEDFVGKYNIDETRDKVEEAIDNYQRFTLGGLSYKFAELTVKCNADNNSPAIINANRLEVEVGIRFNRAVRFVNVLYKILPVATE